MKTLAGSPAAGTPAPTGESPYVPVLPYAPALDGIRALAVAGVLLYHARVSWAPGGFLGVDEFFVLSGYLITSLLLAEHRRNGRIDPLKFWAGRARRLLPAALLVIAVCLVVVAVFLPGELARVRIDALTSVLYVNNWHQVLGSHSYFAAFGRPSLLQHYWSLAVEEQFYLLWPIALIAGLALARRRAVVVGAVAIAVISAALMAALYHSGSDPSRVYYGTDTRAAPLMIGALLAFALPLGGPRPVAWAAALRAIDWIGVIGLVALALMMHGWHDYDPALYRGGFVLAALAAAAAILAAGSPGTAVASALSSGPVRWVGQRSYGIYLWHWPVMALTRPGIDLTWPSWILVPAQIGVTVGLASLSYRYVEMPIRRRVAWQAIREWLDRRRPRERLAVIAATAAALCPMIASAVFVPASSSRQLHHVLASPAATAPIRRTTVAHRGGQQAFQRGDGRVLAVGASVMLAAESALERQLGARVDAAIGRQPGAIIDRLAQYRRAGALPSRVVIQIGDNGPVWSADIGRLRSVLTGVPHVVLVNIREPTSWEGEVNSQLAEAVRSWPQATIANWHGASSNSRLLYDAAHPNPRGASVYANVIARALGGTARTR